MENNLHEICSDVEKAIDYAFNGQFVMKLYDYLKVRKAKRQEVESFIESSTFSEIQDIVKELNEYLEGGQDSNHKQLREAYGHIPKPQARKIKIYLNNIIDDAKRYDYDRKPGRRKKQSK